MSRTLSIPAFVVPATPRLVAAPPAGPAWMHEPKLDGWRCELAKSGSAIALYTRRGYDLASRARAFTQCAAAEIPEPRLLLDGELVAVGDDSRADFHAIATALRQQSPAHLFYFAFDVLGARPTRSAPRSARGTPRVTLRAAQCRRRAVARPYPGHA